MERDSRTLTFDDVEVTITRSAGEDGAIVVFIDGPSEADWMPDGSPRMRVLLNDEPIYSAVPYEPSPDVIEGDPMSAQKRGL